MMSIGQGSVQTFRIEVSTGYKLVNGTFVREYMTRQAVSV